MLRLPDALRAELFVYAREALPEEACGFLFGTRDSGLGTRRLSVTAVRLSRNLHPSREDRFSIDPLEFQKAEAYCAKKKLRVLGFWHSHPKSPPEPSAVDLEHARGLFQSFPKRYLYLIVSLRNPDGELACWRLDEGGDCFEQIPIAAD